ncbi:MAG TPA: cytochrome c oxidase subunit 4 [Acidimicrobiales bacterium]|nr:cytochrome c oxidase subunit 4 [Acidimicrobiales bacterium]
MRVEAIFLLVIAAFCATAALIFWAFGLAPIYLTTTGGGTVMLAACCLLGLLPGSYYLWWSKRMTPRAEDNPEATQADGAGVVGAFPSSSVWPFVFGFGFFMIALALVFGLWSGVFGGSIIISGIVGIIVESRRGGLPSGPGSSVRESG